MKFLLPNLRYHNKHILFERSLSEDNSPVVTVFDTEGNQVDEFGSGNLKEEQILQRILESDKKLATSSTVE